MSEKERVQEPQEGGQPKEAQPKRTWDQPKPGQLAEEPENWREQP